MQAQCAENAGDKAVELIFQKLMLCVYTQKIALYSFGFLSTLIFFCYNVALCVGIQSKVAKGNVGYSQLLFFNFNIVYTTMRSRSLVRQDFRNSHFCTTSAQRKRKYG